jgi:hypothetical protein
MKGEKKMQISKNKAKTTVVILMLMFSSVLILTSAPANAQLAADQPQAGPLPSGATPSITIEAIPSLSFTPNPIGIGQQLLVNMWIQPPINIQRDLADAFQVTFTKPDGTKDVIGPISSYHGDATAWFNYVPDQVGNWTVKFDFLGMYYPEGQAFNGAIVTNSSGTLLGSAYYKPASTAEQPLVVQQDLVMSWPPAPLPTDYWTRPVSPNNREWWPILGNYPATGYLGGGSTWDQLYPNTNPHWSSTYNFIPWVQAPNTAHVVWKRQGEIGGLAGGQLGILDLRANPGYPSIIYAGRCYQTLSKVLDGVTQTVWQCYDLRTGEVYWEKTDVSQIPTIVTYTERSAQAVPGEEAMHRGLGTYLMYIGSGRLIKYNPWDGSVTLNVSTAPLTTSTYYTEEFALGVQSLGGGNYRLINWTTNDAGYRAFSGASTQIATNFADRIVSNITWPISSLPATTDFNAGVAVYTTSIQPPSPSGTGVTVGQGLVGINIQTGAVMWNVTTTAPDGHEQFFSGNTAVADNGKFIVRMITGDIRAWDLYSGNVAWSTQLSYPWGVFGGYHVASAYGLYFCDSYDGFHGINETNGNIEWTFHAYTPYQFETPYQGPNGEEYVFHGGIQVADGKVYCYSMEHTQSQPTTRGLNLYCLNAITGDQLWNFSGSEVGGGRSFTGAIADGYLAFASQLDSMMYVFGKGKSATTVMAPDVSVPLGTSLVIKGTVLDQSPAQPGTPCVSDASMTTYMEYLHIQSPIDGIAHNATITGVPVVLTAIGSDGSVVDLGTVTTNGYYGTFSKTWTPSKEGDYQVIAQFAGDDSYGSSSAGTSLSVGPAVATPSTPEIPTPVDYSMLLYGILAAVVVAIVLALVAILVVLRKR